MGTIPATNEVQGPFRKVVSVTHVEQHRITLPMWSKAADGTAVFGERTYQKTVYAHRVEVLECGHRGGTLWHDYSEPKSRRRCVSCRDKGGSE